MRSNFVHIPAGKDPEKVLRGRGILDKNGFPILDSGAARNKLPKRCHEQLHKFKVQKVETLDYDPLTGQNLVTVTRRCVTCDTVDSRTHWEE